MQPTSQDGLVVVSVGDGVGVRPRAAHLEEDLDGEHGLRVGAAQLHHHPVADLVHGVQLQPGRRGGAIFIIQSNFKTCPGWQFNGIKISLGHFLGYF